MSRYIDADELLKVKTQAYDENGIGLYVVCTGDILCMPTADVREVVRGEWIKFDEGNTVCSLCGYELEDWTQGIFYSYCPNCGADMRKE